MWRQRGAVVESTTLGCRHCTLMRRIFDRHCIGRANVMWNHCASEKRFGSHVVCCSATMALMFVWLHCFIRCLAMLDVDWMFLAMPNAQALRCSEFIPQEFTILLQALHVCCCFVLLHIQCLCVWCFFTVRQCVVLPRFQKMYVPVCASGCLTNHFASTIPAGPACSR